MTAADMKHGVLITLFSVVVACASAPTTSLLTTVQPTALQPTAAQTIAPQATTRGPMRTASPTPPIISSPTLASTPSPTPAATPPPGTPTSERPPSLSVRLMAVGDMMLGWEVGRKIIRKGPAAPWVHVKSYLDQSDLVVGNLECVISRLGEPWPSKLIHLRTPLAAADSLVAGGVDVVSVANNHALDFGQEAFRDTLARLDARGIGYAGGGGNKSAAHAPLTVEENGVRLAFLGYVLPFSSRTTFSTREWASGASRPGLAIGTPEVVAADVTAARAQADIVVVMVHGGVEYRSRPNAAQRAFATAAIDAGASLVLGHHPHGLQGYARQEGALVAFSLGNFLFSRFDGAANDTAIVDVTLTPDGVTSIGWIPLVIVGGVPRPAVGAEVPRVMSRLPEI